MGKRIVGINSVSYGSTGTIMLNIARTAREQGLEFTTYSTCGRTQKKGVEGHRFIGTIAEHFISRVVNRRTGLQGAMNWFGTKKMLREIDRIKPDLIHLHNLHDNYVNVRLLFAYIKKHKIPVVWTLHDCWAMTGHCPHFIIAKCEKWKTGCYECPQYHKYPVAYRDRSKVLWQRKKEWFTGIENMTLVTPSRWLAGIVAQSYLKDYPLEVIHNGIDLSIFRPQESDFRKKHHLEDKYLVLGVSFAWGERKGLDVFIELSKRLDERYQIVMVGTTEAVEKSLPDNIISIRRTASQTEMAQLYSCADVYLNPTREEVLGLVNIESLACGTPVITFRTGGSPETLDESCGIVVDCDDVDELERQTRRVCEEKPFSAEACMEHAKLFQLQDKYDSYVELFRRI